MIATIKLRIEVEGHPGHTLTSRSEGKDEIVYCVECGKKLMTLKGVRD